MIRPLGQDEALRLLSQAGAYVVAWDKDGGTGFVFTLDGESKIRQCRGSVAFDLLVEMLEQQWIEVLETKPRACSFGITVTGRSTMRKAVLA
jgi:hypothetical protein